MKLSILDQAPISEGVDASRALQESVKLAQYGEKLGYKRYWIAEHHDLPGLANPAPDIMLSYIGAKTKNIRIGAGAVLLPHYKPFNVAERFNLLATLFPNRIDLGIGRAPGGSAEATMALSDNFLEQVKKYPDHIDELIQFLNDSFPNEHMFSNISPEPVPKISPQPWLLGTSEKSALLAAEKGLPYAFAYFMSDKNGPAIIQTYKDEMKKYHPTLKPKVILAVSAICAESEEEANEISLSAQLWQLRQNMESDNKRIPSIEEAKQYLSSKTNSNLLGKIKRKMNIGNPSQVIQQFITLQEMYQANELMILTITHAYEARLRSYQLIAEEMNNHK